MRISSSSHQADEVYTNMYTKIVILLKTKPRRPRFIFPSITDILQHLTIDLYILSL